MAGKNPNGSGSIGKYKEGWRAQYTVGRDPKTGKLIRKAIYGKTQKEVRDKLLDITKDIKDETFVEPSKMTVSQWLDEFIEKYVIDVKPSTQRSYKTYCEWHLKPTLGRIKLTALTAKMIQDAYAEIAKGKTSQKEELSAKTMKNCHGVLHKALSVAQRMGYIRSNPSDAVILPKIQPFRIEPLTNEQIPVFLDTIKHHKFEDIYKTYLATGMREAEALALTWDCVDFESRTIKVEKQLVWDKGNGYIFGSPKNDKARVIPMPNIVYEIFQKLKMQPNAENPQNLVFVNDDGRYIIPKTVLANYAVIAKKLGLSTRLHNLRHTYATLCLQNGDSIKTVQENLGHATAAFTMQVYGHVTDLMKKESASKMDKYFNSLENNSMNNSTVTQS